MSKDVNVLGAKQQPYVMFGSSPSELEVASIVAAFEAEGNPVEIPQAAVPE
jgi:hypothetical protein